MAKWKLSYGRVDTADEGIPKYIHLETLHYYERSDAVTSAMHFLIRDVTGHSSSSLDRERCETIRRVLGEWPCASLPLISRLYVFITIELVIDE